MKSVIIGTWLLLSSILFLGATNPYILGVAGGAPLTVDNTTTLDQDAVVDPMTFNHTTAAGANLLSVTCTVQDADDLLSATYDAVSMTQEADSASGRFDHAMSWSLQDPNSGTLEVSADAEGTVDGSCVARSYFNGGVIDGGTQEAPAGVTSSSLNVTCVDGGEVISGLQLKSTIQTITEGAGQTVIHSGDEGAASYIYSVEAGASTVTVSYSWPSSDDASHVAVCVNPA